MPPRPFATGGPGAVASSLTARATVVTAAALAAVASLSVGSVSRDDGLLEGAAHLPWPAIFAVVVVATLAAAHYLLAAVALRAGSGTTASYRSTTAAQLAAASVNRIVPGGVGGAAVNVRFLRRSGLTPADALTALLGLGAVGAVADFLFAAGVISVGPVLGVTGGAHEISVLGSHGLRAGRHAPWAALLVAAAGIATVVVVRSRRRSSGSARASDGPPSLRQLAAHPRRWLLALPASAGTTAVLAVGFALSVRALAGTSHGLPPFGALLAVYLVAAAAGSAVPLPAFLGTTEAALVGALVVSGVAAHTALVATLLFRLVAFWAPAPLGVYAARRLRATQRL